MLFQCNGNFVDSGRLAPSINEIIKHLAHNLCVTEKEATKKKYTSNHIFTFHVPANVILHRIFIFSCTSMGMAFIKF